MLFFCGFVTRFTVMLLKHSADIASTFLQYFSETKTRFQKLRQDEEKYRLPQELTSPMLAAGRRSDVARPRRTTLLATDYTA